MFSDFEELQAGTDGNNSTDVPFFADTNGDGVSDGVDKALEGMNKERCESNLECETRVCSSGVCLGPGEQQCESVADCRTGACAMASSGPDESTKVCCRSGVSIGNVCTGQTNGSPCTEDAICASLHCNADGICETLQNNKVETSDENGSGTTGNVNTEDIDEISNLLTEEENEFNNRSAGDGCGTGCKIGSAAGGAVAGAVVVGAVGAAMRKKVEEVERDDLASSSEEEDDEMQV